MFIGHFGVGFAAKQVAPRVSLGTAFLAAQFLDLLWPTFLLLFWLRLRSSWRAAARRRWRGAGSHLRNLPRRGCSTAKSTKHLGLSGSCAIGVAATRMRSPW